LQAVVTHTLWDRPVASLVTLLIMVVPLALAYLVCTEYDIDPRQLWVRLRSSLPVLCCTLRHVPHVMQLGAGGSNARCVVLAGRPCCSAPWCFGASCCLGSTRRGRLIWPCRVSPADRA
jgi:hypothetical protein